MYRMQLKKKFDTGNYFCVYDVSKIDSKKRKWTLFENPSFKMPPSKYRLVHKKDADVLNAWLIGVDVEVLWDAGLSRECWKTMAEINNDFLESYNELATYRVNSNGRKKAVLSFLNLDFFTLKDQNEEDCTEEDCFEN